jgi:hypothetical protein
VRESGGLLPRRLYDIALQANRLYSKLKPFEGKCAPLIVILRASWENS